LAAVLAVNDILEAEGASTVGAPGSEPSLEFNIGYEFITEDDNVGGVDVTFVHVESGRTGANPPPAWEALDSVWYHIYETQTWADFTIVDFIGDGNLPPRADANGRYTGIVGVEVAFTSRGSSDPDGKITSYEWDFGDDSLISNEPNPSHIYGTAGVYIVTLTVTDDSGVPDSDFTIATIAVSERPEADPNGPYVGSIDDAVTFDGSGSSDPDGDDAMLVYEWDFGDDSAISNEQNPSYNYTETGVYIVTLTVTDDSGASDSTRTTATIATGSLPPLAEAGSPVIGTEGTAVEFDGSHSRALNVGGSITSYDWDFGDGTSGIGETPSHTYAVADAYNVTLTVTDNKGKTDSDHTLATIGEPSALDCSDARPSRDTIWPPSRRFVTVEIRGVDSDGSPVIITIDSIFQDEQVFFIDGFGVGIPTEPARVRAFRWPTAFGGNGRVYTIGFTAVDTRGGNCEGEVKVEVPISEGDKAVDDGATYDSTVSSFFDF
jgi:PKD repeat protein